MSQRDLENMPDFGSEPDLEGLLEPESEPDLEGLLEPESEPDRESRPARRERQGSHGRPSHARRPSSGPRRGQRPPSRSGKKRRRKKKKKSRTGKIILIVVIVAIVALIAAGVGIFVHMYGLMDTSAIRGRRNATPEPTPEAAELTPAPTEEPTPEPTPTPEPLTEEEIARLEELALMESLQEDAEEILYSDSVYNILLLGADGRKAATNKGSEIERSDAMIVLSINRDTKQIWLTSLMRDTQINYPGGGKGHLNWCTALGGVDFLIQTIEAENNFAFKINNWALADFVDFGEIAGMLGPVTVTVEAREVADINLLIREGCQYRDIAYKLKGENTTPRSYFPEGGGTFTIDDGFQILGYCRERHYGGDTGRSNRQREVLMQMWENAKKMPLKKQYELVEAIMKLITTDMTMGQCASLLLSAPSFIDYEIHAQQVPIVGGMWKGRDDQGLSAYFADFRVNRNLIRATIYGEKMTAYDLTSSWTGEKVLVWWPPEE